MSELLPTTAGKEPVEDTAESVAELARSLTPAALHLVVLATEQCNFRCTYCFEDFVLPKMPESVVRGLENLLERRAQKGLRQLSIGWFGGEPLLAVDTVMRVQRHAQRLAQEHPGLRIEAGMTTNGYRLDASLLADLVQAGVTAFEISLDGPAEAHDKRRMRADGAATFARIWDNLLAARRSAIEFQIKVRVHVDRENKTQIPRFLEQLADLFRDDPRFLLFLREISRLGGRNDAQLPVLEGAEIGRELAVLRARALELGLREAPLGDGVCYASRGNSYVLRSNGALCKCSVALTSPHNHVGWLGEDGTMQVDGQAMGAWMRGLWSDDRRALECPLEGIEGAMPVVASATRQALVQLPTGPRRSQSLEVR